MAKYLKQADAVFFRMDGPRTPMHVGVLLPFRLPPRVSADFLKGVLTALRGQPLAAPFNCRLAQPRLARVAPAWEEAGEIDMDYHVRHSALPTPGGERELGMLIARLQSVPLDYSRPLWELHLIEGLEHDRFAVYLKAHHALADGATGIRLIKGWLSEDPDDRTLDRGFFSAPVEKRSRGEATNRRMSRLQGMVEAVDDQLAGLWELMRTLRRLGDRERYPDGGLYSAADTPRTPFNVPITAQRRVATQLYDFARFKALSDATGATINDIVLAITGGAMRRYLMEYNALPERSMIASVPVALPRRDARGNAVAGFVVPLGTDDADPLARLHRIQTVTRETKQELQKLSPTALTQFAMLGLLPMVLGQASGLGARLPPLCNITVSNVPGPKTPLYLGGAELEAIYPVSLLFDGYAVNLSLVSYAGRYCFGYVGCRDALPHLQRLAVYTGLALSDLEVAVTAGSPRGSADRRSALRR